MRLQSGPGPPLLDVFASLIEHLNEETTGLLGTCRESECRKRQVLIRVRVSPLGINLGHGYCSDAIDISLGGKREVSLKGATPAGD